MLLLLLSRPPCVASRAVASSSSSSLPADSLTVTRPGHTRPPTAGAAAARAAVAAVAAAAAASSRQIDSQRPRWAGAVHLTSPPPPPSLSPRPDLSASFPPGRRLRRHCRGPLSAAALGREGDSRGDLGGEAPDLPGGVEPPPGTTGRALVAATGPASSPPPPPAAATRHALPPRASADRASFPMMDALLVEPLESLELLLEPLEAKSSLAAAAAAVEEEEVARRRRRRRRFAAPRTRSARHERHSSRTSAREMSVHLAARTATERMALRRRSPARPQRCLTTRRRSMRLCTVVRGTWRRRSVNTCARANIWRPSTSR
ncbi:uncharacterized protein LOC144938136 [Lampetra fluviatilis]